MRSGEDRIQTISINCGLPIFITKEIHLGCGITLLLQLDTAYYGTLE